LRSARRGWVGGVGVGLGSCEWPALVWGWLGEWWVAGRMGA
jgi:hypothetical protein